MASKLIAFFLTMAVLTASGIIILMLMLVAMNGFSEGDAMWGVGTYSLLCLLVIGAMGTGAILLTARFVKRGFSPLVACLIAVPALTLVGIIVEAVCSLLGVATAEIVRRNF